MTDEKFEPIPVTKILEMIPHRYPILLVDRIVDLKKGESVVGLKNVTMNEPHFTGHFPDVPILPGVLIIEALAQAAGVLAVNSMGENAKDKLVYFMAIDDARFRKPVTPGDSLYLHIEVIRTRGAVWKFKGTAKVDDKVVSEATFSAMIVDKESAG